MRNHSSAGRQRPQLTTHQHTTTHHDIPVECHGNSSQQSCHCGHQQVRDSVSTVRDEEQQVLGQRHAACSDCCHTHHSHGNTSAAVQDTVDVSNSTGTASSSTSWSAYLPQGQDWSDEYNDEMMMESAPNMEQYPGTFESDEEMEDIEADDDDDEDDVFDGSSYEDESDGESSSSQQENNEVNEEHQKELRKQIIQIQTDSSIPAAEKAKRIQELMTKGWTTKQQKERSREVQYINRLANKKNDFSVLTEEDKQKTHHSGNILGCKHYQRACKLQAHCCGKWDTCRFCHDEVSDHTITRNLITTMMCMYCATVQDAGQDCINPDCGKRVAKYYCKECKLWDDDPRKNIYHCYDCGICRIGKGLGIDYFHCKVCNVCMAIGLKGRHKCIERNLESDCPICGEYMFTSTSTVIFMPCGHCMHHKCHQQYIQTSYQCPTCLKSLADMTDYFRRIDLAMTEHQMPPEYNNTYSHVYCNDCEKKSHAKFHFIYHKCGHCLGYNTKVLSTAAGRPSDAVVAPEVTLETIAQQRSTQPNQTQQSSSAQPNVNVAEDNISDPEVSSSSHASVESAQQRQGLQRPLFEYQYSSSSVGSSSRSVPQSSFWCHNCQLPTDVLSSDAGQICVTCSSDFVEEM